MYAIYFAMQVLGLIPVLVQLFASEEPGHHFYSFGEGLVSILIFTVVGGILWVLADRLAARVAREFNPTLDKFTLTLETAYTFGFFFLGLYFVLASIASALQQLYYVVAVVAQLPESDPQRSIAMFQLYKPGITLIAGFASLFGAPFWARKLISFGAKKSN
jgi:hypothetical protein